MIITLILFIIYLIALFSKRRKEKTEYENARKKLYNIVERQCGTENLHRLIARQPWKDMPDCLIHFIKNYAYCDEFPTETAEHYNNTFCFHPIPKKRSNEKQQYREEYYPYDFVIYDWKINRY